MGRKRIALIQYASPAVVPADLRIVAAVNYSGGTPPDNLLQVSSYWYDPGDAIPDRYEKVGAVTYASPAVVPNDLKAVAAMEPDVVLDAVEYPELIGANGGFETAGAGGADVFANWTEFASDGAIVDEETIVHSGSHAAKLIAGAAANTYIYRSFTVVPGRSHTFTIWTRGDGTYAGLYYVYDNTNAAYIIGGTSTGVTDTNYTKLAVPFTVPAGCVSVQIALRCPTTNGGIAYFDDVSVKGPTE